jgi:radical SAM superfamily enzyme YgiQ (UPF0313 family)
LNQRRDLNRVIDERLAQERGTIYKHGSLPIALVYPSPYQVGMSSLGFQLIYRLLNERPDTVCERAFLPDDIPAWRASRSPLVTYEGRRAVGDLPIVAFSLSYELELPGVMECLSLSGLPVLAEARGPQHPLVVIGGPLTFSNPVPASPFADVIVMGEAEEAILTLVDLYEQIPERGALLRALAALPGFYVPVFHGENAPAVIAADNALLPAYSAILTPNTELSDMFLVESERGCHRACTFCVMRRSTNGGMRLASVERILACVPEEAKKVGLVGAAVSDHPELVPLVRALVESGRQVSLSSLRADRLTPELVEWLARGGYRTITVASDGASERLRAMMRKNIRAQHLRAAAELVRDHGLKRLKMYMMIGVPNETDEDIEELIAFCDELRRICPVAVGIAPFVAKRNTPLDRQPFAGIALVEGRLKTLSKRLGGKVDLRSTSARWAWVEYCLAQGGAQMGLAAKAAWEGRGSFGAWRRAIEAHGGEPRATAAPPSIPLTRQERLEVERAERRQEGSP